jgi:WG containing repeat
MKKITLLVLIMVIFLLSIKFYAHSKNIVCAQESLIDPYVQKSIPKFMPYKFSSKENWGLVQENGNQLTEAQFSEINDFSEERASFKDSSGQFGYLDLNGKIVIQAHFDRAEPFNEGLAAVQKQGRWGYINRNGQILFPLKLAYAGPFNNKRAFISTGKLRDGKLQYGVIDSHGNLIFEEIFTYYSMFVDGVALVNSGSGHNLRTLLLKENGEIKEIKDIYGIEYSQYSNGLIPVASIKKDWIFKEIDRFLSNSHPAPLVYGFIDKNGDFAIQPRFLYANQFKSCIASVKSGELWGLIDTKGDFILKPQFKNEPRYLGEGLVKVNTEFQRIESELFLREEHPIKNGVSITFNVKYRLMDLEGNWITPTYDNLGALSEGMISFQVGKKWGFLDSSGKIVISPKFDSVADFKFGYARVFIDGEHRYINFSGKYLPNPTLK